MKHQKHEMFIVIKLLPTKLATTNLQRIWNNKNLRLELLFQSLLLKIKVTQFELKFFNVFPILNV